MSEAGIRLVCFSLVLLGLAIWERTAPGYPRTRPLNARWPANFGLAVVGILLVRIVFRAAAVGAATYAAKEGIGLFNSVVLPFGLTVIFSVMLLDLVIYLQHRLFHVVPALWSLHRVHHADPELDVSSALRFHPIEALLSMILKAGMALAIGMPPLAVLIFEIMLNATAMFNHSNGALPPWLEKAVIRILVTPNMHRIHHSTDRAQANTNFGFSVPWWDRLFRTYRHAADHSGVETRIGLPDGPPEDLHLRLPGMLTMPFNRSRARR